MPQIIIPHTDPAQSTNVSRSGALAASLIVKNTAGVLYSVSGYNSGAAGFLQLHDSATLPADAAVPLAVIAIPATGNFSMDFGLLGLPFFKGMVVCNSSTAPTKTIGGAELFVTALCK